MSVACPCPKELEVQKKGISPGPVTDDEPIIYVIIDPLQWKGNYLSNAAFSKSKLKDGELSVCRAAYSSPSQLHQCVIDHQLEKDKKRKLIGVMKSICSDLRSIKDEVTASRAICVIDDGNENDKSHAHLSFSEPVKVHPRNVLESIRGNLILAFGNEPMSLKEAFS